MPRTRTPDRPTLLRGARLLDVDKGEYVEPGVLLVEGERIVDVTPAKVPDDASVVVIADPTATLPANGVEAIRKYMSEPRPDGKKGKLVVLAGMQPGPDRKPLLARLDWA